MSGLGPISSPISPVDFTHQALLLRAGNVDGHGEKWVWHALQQALDALKPVRVECQHQHAATLAAIEQEAFSRRYDERVSRFRVQSCVSALARLLSAATALEVQATAALVAHSLDEATWKKELVKTATEGDAFRRSLAAELAQAETRLRERTENEALLMQENSEMRSVFDASVADLSRESQSKAEQRDAVRAELDAQRAENVRLLDAMAVLSANVSRESEALSQEKAEAASAQQSLHEEIEALRRENTQLRERAVTLRGDLAISSDNLATEKQTVIELRREGTHVSVEHQESQKEIGRLVEENMTLRQQAAALRNQLVDRDEALAAKDHNILELRREHGHTSAELERLLSQRERERARLTTYLDALNEEVGAQVAQVAGGRAISPSLAPSDGPRSVLYSPSRTPVYSPMRSTMLQPQPTARRLSGFDSGYDEL